MIDTTWHDAAACTGTDVAVFYPPDQDTSRHPRWTPDLALTICARCPVTTPCLEQGMGDAWGVWGGTTPEDRAAIRRRTRHAKGATA